MMLMVLNTHCIKLDKLMILALCYLLTLFAILQTSLISLSPKLPSQSLSIGNLARVTMKPTKLKSKPN